MPARYEYKDLFFRPFCDVFVGFVMAVIIEVVEKRMMVLRFPRCVRLVPVPPIRTAAAQDAIVPIDAFSPAGATAFADGHCRAIMSAEVPRQFRTTMRVS